MSSDFTRTFYDRYLALGWSVIPVARREKKPLVSWKNAQKIKTTREMVLNWLDRYPTAGIAVVTGSISGVFVIDVDTQEALESDFVKSLPPTATVRTSKGVHYYYKIPAGVTIPTKVKFLPGIDCRGEGGYAILPPSEHASGAFYEWLVTPDSRAVPGPVSDDSPSGHTSYHSNVCEAPKAVISSILAGRATLESWTQFGETKWRSHLDGVTEGSRNDAAASVIGKVLADSPVELWETMCWKYINDDWNFRNNPPLPSTELRTTFDSIAQKERTRRANLAGVGISDSLDVADIQITSREPEFAVRDFIVEGLNILMGKPKKGKSTLIQQLVLDVAEGNEFLYAGDLAMLPFKRRFPTLGGPVLHLALEDDPMSYARRANFIAESRSIPRGIDLRTTWLPMFDGGISALDDYLRLHPDTRMVVIDTLVAFLAGGYQKAANAHQVDYRMYSPLHDLAIKHHKPIVVLVHARKDAPIKRTDADPMDAVAGTLGGNAAADNLIHMERLAFDSDLGYLSVQGRFIKSYRLPFKQVGWRFHMATDAEVAQYLEERKKKKSAA